LFPMMSSRLAASNLWPPNSYKSALARTLSYDWTPSMWPIKSICRPSRSRQPETRRYRIVGTQDHSFQRRGHPFQLLHIPGSLPKKQVDVDSGNRSAVQGRRHVSNKDRFETIFVEGPGQQNQLRLGVHHSIIASDDDSIQRRRSRNTRHNLGT
jgi:hypothetical protein